MRIDWAALGVVAAVSIAATLVFVVLLASGIRFVSAARIRANENQPSTTALSLGYTMLACAGLLVLFCLWLIVPQFH